MREGESRAADARVESLIVLAASLCVVMAASANLVEYAAAMTGRQTALGRILTTGNNRQRRHVDHANNVGVDAQYNKNCEEKK